MYFKTSAHCIICCMMQINNKLTQFIFTKENIKKNNLDTYVGLLDSYKDLTTKYLNSQH